MTYQNDQWYCENLIGRIRHGLKNSALDEAKLPDWVTKRCAVRHGRVNDSIIMVVESTFGVDSFRDMGDVGCDSVVLLDTCNFKPVGWCHDASKHSGVNICGYNDEGDPMGVPLFKLAHNAGWWNCGHVGSHFPFAHLSLAFAVANPKNPNGILALRIVPLAICFHENERDCWAKFVEKITETISSTISFPKFPTLNFPEENRHFSQSYGVFKKDTVVVLGKDTDKELQTLFHARDFLRSKGYRALLIKELPEISETSNEEKVRYWTGAARFCVMIDEAPAGHIAEYEILKNQRTVFALLRPKGYGSTYMIGDDHVPHIKKFEYDADPCEVIDHVILWAEATVDENIKHYKEEYSWRSDNKLR